ncbi:MAG TPA: YdcF family protein [Azospirillaceae bacterium]|nr:YdcF family protein [Azospirillaceae bacterium]
MKPLESRFSPPQLPERVDGIIVLGGAVAPTVSKGRGQPAVNQAAERLIEFAGLARHYPAARLVFTGGSGQLTHQDTPEVPVARTALERMGLDPARVLFEGESRNTWENALYSLDLVKPSEGEVWVLVTSAYHMPRSVGIFRRVGWRVVPYPVDYRTQLDPDFPRFDLIWGMDLASDAIREWIGLAAYRLMGRTDSLFPKPG